VTFSYWLRMLAHIVGVTVGCWEAVVKLLAARTLAPFSTEKHEKQERQALGGQKKREKQDKLTFHHLVICLPSEGGANTEGYIHRNFTETSPKITKTTMVLCLRSSNLPVSFAGVKRCQNCAQGVCRRQHCSLIA